MTIEIRELVIQAQVTQESVTMPASSPSVTLPLARAERDHLITEITRQVLEQLREEQERVG